MCTGHITPRQPFVFPIHGRFLEWHTISIGRMEWSWMRAITNVHGIVSLASCFNLLSVHIAVSVLNNNANNVERREQRLVNIFVNVCRIIGINMYGTYLWTESRESYDCLYNKNKVLWRTYGKERPFNMQKKVKNRTPFLLNLIKIVICSCYTRVKDELFWSFYTHIRKKRFKFR